MPGPETFVVDTTSAGSVQLSTLSPGGYDALDDRGRRRPAKTRTYGEDRILNGRGRRALTATARDAVRNFSLVAWMVRRHLDYVTTFNFQARTADRGFNKEFEAFVEEVSQPRRFDLARRHGREKAIRITEARAVVDGDAGWLKFARGRNFGRVQIFEGDRIALPNQGVPIGVNREEWVNGVRVNEETGEAREYALCNRNRKGPGLSFKRSVPARSMIMRGYYERADQVRGVSPMAAALNELRDIYEVMDFTRAKIKVAKLFGLKITRSSSRPLEGDPGEYDDIDMNRGPFQLDLDPGDDADFLESKTPATEVLNFLKLQTQVALKSIDVPYSFFDEAHTNFYGSRGGLIQYLIACHCKRLDNIAVQNAWLRWRVGLAVASGEFPLPSGKEFDFLAWLFVPRGVPWWDPSKEITGYLKAIAAGLTSPQRVCIETGTNLEENLEQLAEALKLANKLGLTLDFGTGGGVDLRLLEDAMQREQRQQDEDNDAE